MFGPKPVLRDEDTGDNQGGGGSQGQSESGEEAKSFTQEELEAHIKQRLKARDTEIDKLKKELSARPSVDDFKSIQSDLEKLREDKSMEGKNELERAEHRWQKEVEKRDNQITQLTKRYEETQAQLEARDKAARESTIKAQFSTALAKAGVLSSAASDARDQLVSALKDVELSDDGSALGTYGKLIDASPEEIAAQFLTDRPFYKSAGNVGGSGEKPRTGHRSATPESKKGVDDIAAGLGQSPQ